jgi:hypothetical protein
MIKFLLENTKKTRNGLTISGSFHQIGMSMMRRAPDMLDHPETANDKITAG